MTWGTGVHRLGTNGTARARATQAEARSFGFSVGGVCGAVAAYGLWRGRLAVALVFGLLASVLVGAALAAPAALRGPSVLWTRLAHALAWVNTRVLLSAVFFLVLTPIGVLLRVGGWDPLGRRRSERPGWTPYPERRRDPKHYEKMY